jgi:hypothetical protein
MKMSPSSNPSPNQPIAGCPKRPRRYRLTAAGHEALRLTALKNQPWRRSTGPRTQAGKAKVAANGKSRQKGAQSVREMHGDLASVRELLTAMANARRAAEQSSIAK